MDQIDLNTQGMVLPTDTINLAGPPVDPVPEAGVAQTRATKASVGLQNVTGKTKDDWLHGLLQGQETDLRNEASTEANYQRIQDKQKFIQNVSQMYPDAASLANDQYTMSKITGVPPTTDPKSVIEEYFAGKYLQPMWDLSDQFNQGGFLPVAMQTAPREVESEVDAHTNILARQQYFQTALEKAQQEHDSQGAGATALEMGREYFPLFPYQLYQEAKLRGWSGNKYIDKPLGDALKATAEDLYRLPWAEAQQRFDAAMKSLPAEMKVKFASYMVGQPGDAVEQENAAEVLNLAGDITMVGGVMRTALKAPLKSVMNVNKPKVSPGDVEAASAAGQGNMKAAAEAKVAQSTMDKMTGATDPVKEAIDPLPTALRGDIDYYRNVPGRSGQEIANRVSEDTANSLTKLEDATTSAMKINQVSALEANKTVAKLAVNELAGKYGGINSTVLDLGDPRVTFYKNTNRYTVDIPLGDHDAEMFKNMKQARSFARAYNLPDSAYTIVKHDVEGVEKTPLFGGIRTTGNAYYLSVPVNLDVRSNLMWDSVHDIPGNFSGSASLAPRKGSQIPYLNDPVTGQLSDRTWNVVQAYWNSMNGKAEWRSPEETLSPDENKARGIATFGPGRLMKMFQDNNKLVMDGNTKDLKRVLVNNQSMPDPNDPTIRGMYFKGIGELENHFQQFIGRDPNEKEIRAYFAVKNNYEMERGLMSLMEIRNKANNGVMSWRISKLGEGTGKSNPIINSDRFDARPINHFPQDGENLFVNVNGKQYVVRNDRMNAKTMEVAKDKMRTGEWRMLELWNQDTKPLHNFSDKIDPKTQPNYVLTETARSDFQALNSDSQVVRRGGGHLIPQYGHYIKQADVYLDPSKERYVYRGDITATAVRNEAEGREAAMHLNKIREHLAAGDEAGARKYVQDTGVLGMDFDKDILKRYRSDFKPFNTTEPFQVVPVNKTIPDIDDSLAKRFTMEDGTSALQDGTRRGNLSKTSTVAFNEQRDMHELHTLENYGTAGNPIWQYRPAKLLDPMDALNRSMARLANSYYMDDYRTSVAQRWLQTFTPWLDMSQQDIRRAPLYAFFNAEWKRAAPEQVKLLGESNRKKSIDFLGTPNAFQAMVNTMGNAMYNDVYKRRGGEALPAYTELARSRDPLQVLRGLTFDMKLGLGAIPTFWTQFTAMSNVHAINPRQAASSTMAMLYHNWARVNPTIIDELDKRASSGQHLRDLTGQSTWKPGQFKEAWDLMHTTSFAEVGNEHAAIDGMLADRGIQTMTDGVRYWGRTMFREGAQAVRTAAWYSAYLEAREEKPVGALTREDESSILARARMLDHDMSRASNSTINSGLMSVPAQFYTYARNLSEMFYGKRLTWQEKARLFGVNATLWGLPAGGIGLLGLPVGDWFRKGAEAGKYNIPFTQTGVNNPGGAYTPGEAPVSTAIFDGVLTVLGAYITGKGDFQAGTTYDFSKFGVKGWDPINNFLDTDKTVWDFLSGASGQTLHNTIYRSHNFLADVGDLLTGGDKFKFTGQDVADIFKESSSFSNVWKTYMMLAHRTAFSNNNTPLENNISPVDALWRFASGTESTDISDIGTRRQIISDRENYMKYVTAQASRNFNLGLLAKRDNDDDGYIQYFKKGNGWLASADFAPDKRTDELHSIFSRRSSLIDSINWQLTQQNVPEDKEAIERQRATTIQTLKDKRGK